MKFLIKEIKSKEGEVHFRRWRILSTPWFSIYIHGIYKADEDLHLHDHPWDYVSIVLKGFFTEKTLNYNFIKDEKGISAWRNASRNEDVIGPTRIIKRKAEQFHTIESLHGKSVYTLFFTGKRRREWGYDVDGKWIDHKTYRQLKNENKLK